MKKYKRSPSELYLIKKNDITMAVSDHLEYIMKYINQFPDCLATEDCEIHTISDEKDIRTTLTLYLEDLMLDEFGCRSDIILTKGECRWYNYQLRQTYDDTKNAICQLLILNNMMDLRIEEKVNIKSTFDLLYGKSITFNEFKKSLDKKYLIEKFIVTPVALQKMIKDIQFLDDEYKNKMNDEKQ